MSRPLHIAMLSHMASPSAPTGAERSLALLARGLRERGHHVDVVTPGPWALEEDLLKAGVKVWEIACRPCWLTYHDPIPWPRAALKWLRYALPDFGGLRIKNWLASRKPDVVHVNCLPHIRAAEWAAGGEHGHLVAWHIREILPRGVRREWFAKRLERYAHRIVAVSEAVGQWIRDEGLAKRLSVIPNGVEPGGDTIDPAEARQALGLPAEGFLIGIFGQIVPHKGVSHFVDAAHLALAEQPGLRFLIAGPGPEDQLARVRAAIEAGRGRDRIHLLPPQPSAERLLAAADAVCLTTLTPDPFPRAVLEAMARGLPVVAYRGGGVAEMVRHGETGLLVESGDKQGLAGALARLGADPAASRAMGAAGRRVATAEFSLERHLDRMESLFRDEMMGSR